MTLYIRICPACRSERPLNEDECLNIIEPAQECRFPLLDINPSPLRAKDNNPVSPTETIDAANGANGLEQEPKDPKIEGLCPNGHTVEADDVLCLTCGARIVSSLEDTSPVTKHIGGWEIVTELPQSSSDAERYLARRSTEEAVCVLRQFQAGLEPDPALYKVLERLDRADIARLLDHGREDGRAYEVWEHVEGEALGSLGKK